MFFYEMYVPNCNSGEIAIFTVTAAGYYTETVTHIITLSNNIDIIDALLIAQYYVGLIDSFPC